MLPAFLLALREGLEAALVIGIVLGVLQKTNRRELIPIVWRGVVSAVLASFLVASLLQGLGSEFEGKAEEIYKGITMILAASLLTWMIFWMQRQARSVQKELENSVKRTALSGGWRALFVLAFVAVGREGLELALFLAASSFASNAFQSIVGALAGILVSALLGYILFTSTRRLSLRRFFQVTNVLLILFAAGLVAHGVHEFNEAGLIPEVIEHIWNLNPILNEDGGLGRFLATLFGYNANPSLTELAAYLGYFMIVTFVLSRARFTHREAVPQAKVRTSH